MPSWNSPATCLILFRWIEKPGKSDQLNMNTQQIVHEVGRRIKTAWWQKPTDIPPVGALVRRSQVNP
jgi:hypothetical protein